MKKSKIFNFFTSFAIPLVSIIFFGCNNAPSQEPISSAAENLEDPVGTNIFLGTYVPEQSYGSKISINDDFTMTYYQKEYKYNEETGTSEETGNYTIDSIYKYTFNSEEQTFTRATYKKINLAPSSFDMCLQVDKEYLEYMVNMFNYDISVSNGNTETTQPSQPTSAYAKASYQLYTAKELQETFSIYINKLHTLYDEYILKFSALLNTTSDNLIKTRISSYIGQLKFAKIEQTIESILHQFSIKESFTYSISQEGSITLTSKYTNNIKEGMFQCIGCSLNYGTFMISTQNPTLTFYTINLSITDNTLSGTLIDAINGYKDVGTFLANYTLSGSSNDTILTIDLVETPSDYSYLKKTYVLNYNETTSTLIPYTE